jgi:hypothetical protein
LKFAIDEYRDVLGSEYDEFVDSFKEEEPSDDKF